MINVIDASEKRTVDLEFGAIGWQVKKGKSRSFIYTKMRWILSLAIFIHPHRRSQAWFSMWTS